MAKFKKGDAAKFVVPDLCGRIVDALVTPDGEFKQVLRYVCPATGQLKETAFDPEQLVVDENPVTLPEPVEHEPIKQTEFVEGEGPDAEADATSAA